MERKESIKTMFFGALSLPFWKVPFRKETQPAGFETKAVSAGEPMRSRWADWPDMKWVGPEYWGNRLQDWRIRDGKAECTASAANRTLHLLTHQVGGASRQFSMSVNVELLQTTGSANDKAGFRIGAKAADDPVTVEFEDDMRDAVFGVGLEAGIDGDGKLFIGEERSDEPVDTQNGICLHLDSEEGGGPYRLHLRATDIGGDNELLSFSSEVSPEQLKGNAALLSHFPSVDDDSAPSVRFSDWRLSGAGVIYQSGQTYGPICFAQYTLDRGILKMTAQLTPVEMIDGHDIELQLREGGNWKTVQNNTVHKQARTAHFRVEEWDGSADVPYRLVLNLPLKSGTEEYSYEGTIAADPVSSDQLKTAVFSCNSHYGFPNKEVVENVSKHRPDMAVFLGDQIYESHGGFGVERTSDVEKAALDYLRKWYMFGWSYRDLFRHIPAAFIPDDHDVFHGNIWGEGGKKAPTDDGWGYAAQDQGGYKYPAEWVNQVVQRTLTSHLPDPFDPTRVKQGIGVYYTDWVYGGVSFAILEDRKFKTAPKNVLPEEAQVVNGFIQNRDFDIKQHYDIDADLLGERQMTFLEHWTADWSRGAQMKAVFSQTNFCTLATLPEGSILDDMVPGLEIPERGTYVKGDAPTTDMDSNGWPMKQRDNTLRTLRKGFALHIAGDQHLASTVRYGVDEHGDAGFAFAGPALNNIWPRRWWPPVEPDHKPLPGRPKNTGDFEDGFGNKLTVYAVANPVQTNRKPGLIYDRSTGYGIVVFDKTERTMRIECWPRYVDPEANPEGQYDGWPVQIRQEENYGRTAFGYLPEIQVEGLDNPVIEVHNQKTGELEYALRIKGRTYRPKVFEDGTYRVRVGEPDENRWQEFGDLTPSDEGEVVVCVFE
jgi:hypothetical protein